MDGSKTGALGRGNIQQQRVKNTKNRSGVAPLELLLFLPIYLAFIAAMVWIARVRLAELEAASDTASMVQEEVALSDHEQIVPDGGNWAELQAPALRKLVDGFEPGLSLVSGGVYHAESVDTGTGVNGLIERSGTVSDANEQLTHAWEDQVFDFPKHHTEQLQLTLPQAIRGIAPDLRDLEAFSALKDFSGGSPAGGIDDLAGMGRQAAQAVTQISNGIRSLERAIAEITTQIEALRQEEFPDWGRIRSLESQRRQWMNQLAALRGGQEHVGDALRIRNRVERPEMAGND